MASQNKGMPNSGRQNLDKKFSIRAALVLAGQILELDQITALVLFGQILEPNQSCSLIIVNKIKQFWI